MTEATQGPMVWLTAASLMTVAGALALPRWVDRPTAEPTPTATASPTAPPHEGAAPRRVLPGAGFSLQLPPTVQHQVRRQNLRRVVQIKRGRRALLEFDSAPLLPWIRATDLPAGPSPWHTGGRVALQQPRLQFDAGGEAWVWIKPARILLIVGHGRLVQVKANWRRPEVLALLQTYRAEPGAGLRDDDSPVVPDARAQVEQTLAALGPAKVKALPRAIAIGIERLPQLDARDATILLRHLALRAKPRPTPPDPAAMPAPQACARCHAFPPADLLPKARWPKQIGEMTQMPPPPGVRPLSPEEVRLAIAYYTARAPETLPVRAPGPQPGDEFGSLEERPAGLRTSTPAASHVAVVDGVISVLDLRTASLYRRAGTGAWTKVAGGLAEPARQVPYGADGALLIASLGLVDPSDRKVGRVLLLPPQTRQVRVLADKLGRTSDAQPGDLDGDGDLDVVAASFGFRTPGGLELLIREGATFQRRTLDDRDGFVRLALVDLDRDGKLDIVALLAQEHEQVVWFRNEGRLRFRAQTLFRAPHPGWGYAGLEAVDLDRDGDLDLVLANGDSLDTRDLLRADHGVSWLENRGDASFRHHRIGLLYGATGLAVGDIDGDGDLDVAASAFLPLVPDALTTRHQIDSVVWFERRGATWVRHALERARSVHPTVAIGDVTGDGRTDLVVGNFFWRSARGQPDRRPLVTIFTRR